MSFLDKKVSDLSLSELQRLIRDEVSRRVPAIPARVAALDDQDNPLIAPPIPSNDTVLKYDGTRVEADKVKAAELEAVMVLASTLVAGDPNASRVEVGIDQTAADEVGIRSFDTANDLTFKLDGQDGSLYAKGKIDWGTASRLLDNDIVEISQQSTASFLTPARVQRNGVAVTSGADQSGAATSWPAPTTKGNLLLMVVSVTSNGTGTPVSPTSSGFTSVQDTTWGTSGRQTILKIENAASRSGTVNVSWAGTSHVRHAVIQIFEYSGVDIVDILASSNTGSSSTPATSTTGTLNQAGELLVAYFGILNNSNQLVDTPTNSFSIVSSAATNSGGQGVKQTASELITTSTTTTSTGVTDHGGSHAWVAQLVTFKAKAIGVTAPAADLLRLYAKINAASQAVAHVQDDAGTENSLAMAPAGTGWRMEYVAVPNVDIANTAATTSGSKTVSISGLAVGDLVVWAGHANNGAQFIFWVDNPVSTAGQITLRYFNADSAARDPASETHHFLVVHLT